MMTPSPNAVIVHLHSDLIESVFANLQRLTHKPGARLAFNASTYETDISFRASSWAWPEARYAEWLPELELVELSRGANVKSKDIDVTVGNATFLFERRG